MLARTRCFALNGVQGEAVSVEAYVRSASSFQFSMVGLPDAAVKESRDRVAAALKNSGFLMPLGHTTVNLSPADLRKEGAAFDLAIALSIILASRQLSLPGMEDILLIGELGLDGRLVAVQGALSMVMAAHAAGIRQVILPLGNAREVEAVSGMMVYPAGSLTEVAQHLAGQLPIPAQIQKNYEDCLSQTPHEMDLAQVRGQQQGRRALEIAAAGGHNLLMVGVPGSGKTMLARCLPGILPPMSQEEAFETTRIHSVVGMLRPGSGIMTQRPFRSPHHSSSMVALIGGSANAKPGEVSLAHNGVLFLDEMPEYPRSVLESLRQPLEDGITTIARVKARVAYPSRFMLVASMNPCPCGYFGSTARHCRCGSHEIRKYQNRVSGPLLDRIDLQVEIDAVPVEEIARPASQEDSATVRERVQKARQIQQQRFQGQKNRTNAGLSGREIEKSALLSQEAVSILRQAASRFTLSMRAYTRLVRVARTIADLAEEEQVGVQAMAEAVQFRMMDAKYWGGHE